MIPKNREQLLRRLAEAVNQERIGDDKEMVTASIVQPVGVTDGERTKLVICGHEMQGLVEFWPAVDRVANASKARMAIGDYGERTQFRERKDSSFDWPKAARTLVMWARRKQTESERNKVLNQNYDLAERLTLELVPEDKREVVSIRGTRDPGQLEVRLSFKAVSNEGGVRTMVAQWLHLLHTGKI